MPTPGISPRRYSGRERFTGRSPLNLGHHFSSLYLNLTVRFWGIFSFRRAVTKPRPDGEENRTKAALLLAGCNLDVRVPEDPCFLSRQIPVEVFLLKDGELQHACNIPLQVGTSVGEDAAHVH